MAITIEISNYNEVLRELKDCQKDFAKGVRRTMLDIARREIKTVARNEVTKVYNIKKGEVSAKFAGYEQTGSISLAGVSIPFFDVKFQQTRSFTPTHFQMTPRARPAGRRSYTVKWKPLKMGGKMTLPSDTGFPVFLGSPSGVSLPWNRLGRQRKPIEVIHSHLSVPQMIDNEKVQPHIEEEISKRVEKALHRNIP